VDAICFFLVSTKNKKDEPSGSSKFWLVIFSQNFHKKEAVLMLIKRSSSYGRALFHMSFVVKYRHRIFRQWDVRERCKQLLVEAAVAHDIRVIEMGFDVDHVHIVVDIGLMSVPEVVKLLKGYTAKLLLREFPELKQDYFWKSGLWSPAYFFDSVGADYDGVCKYVGSQKYY